MCERVCMRECNQMRESAGNEIVCERSLTFDSFGFEKGIGAVGINRIVILICESRKGLGEQPVVPVIQ